MVRKLELRARERKFLGESWRTGGLVGGRGGKEKK